MVDVAASEPLSADAFGLDDNATDFLRKLPPDRAQKILQTLQAEWDTVRSPSAFVTGLAKQVQAQTNGQVGQAVVAQAQSASLTPEQFGLDENAVDFLRKLPPQKTQDILRTLQAEFNTIRSPSAFVTRLANHALAIGDSATAVTPQVLTPEQFGLDEAASSYLRKLHPQRMQEILQTLQVEWDAVRSPSAFVTRMVNESLATAPVQNFAAPLVAPMPRSAGQKTQLVPEELGCDQDASDFLRKLPPQRMQDILERLQAEWSTVRSPSAFVTRLANEALSSLGLAGAGPSLTPVSQWAPVSAAPTLALQTAAPQQQLFTPEDFGIDADASDFLRKLPSQKMQEILETLCKDFDTIRNPSGFVTRLAKEAVEFGGASQQQGFVQNAPPLRAPSRAAVPHVEPLNSSGPYVPNLSKLLGVPLPQGAQTQAGQQAAVCSRDVGLTPEDFGLDPEAADFLRKLPPHSMEDILRRLQAEFATIRSPSAFVTKLANEALASVGQVGASPAPPLIAPSVWAAQHKTPHAEQGSNQAKGLTPEDFGLDAEASDFLRKLPPHKMQDILETLRKDFDTIRNPSGFVTRLAKEAIGPGGVQATQPSGFATSPLAPLVAPQKRSQAVATSQPAGTLTPEQFGLDDNAADFLRKLPSDQAQDILQKLQAEGPTVRNPSGFVTSLAKQYQSGGMSYGAAPGAPARRVAPY